MFSSLMKPNDIYFTENQFKFCLQMHSRTSKTMILIIKEYDQFNLILKTMEKVHFPYRNKMRKFLSSWLNNEKTISITRNLSKVKYEVHLLIFFQK